MPLPTLPFTGYQKLLVDLSAPLQFTILLSFMVLAPLSAKLMQSLRIGPAQFSLVGSAYAFSAGLPGLLAAGFADRFDRKRLLLLFGSAKSWLAPVCGGYLTGFRVRPYYLELTRNRCHCA